MKLNYVLWFKIRMAIGTLVAIWGFVETFRQNSPYDGRRLLIIAGLSYVFSIAYFLLRVFAEKRIREAHH